MCLNRRCCPYLKRARCCLSKLLQLAHGAPTPICTLQNDSRPLRCIKTPAASISADRRLHGNSGVAKSEVACSIAIHAIATLNMHGGANGRLKRAHSHVSPKGGLHAHGGRLHRHISRHSSPHSHETLNRNGSLTHRLIRLTRLPTPYRGLDAHERSDNRSCPSHFAENEHSVFCSREELWRNELSMQTHTSHIATEHLLHESCGSMHLMPPPLSYKERSHDRLELRCGRYTLTMRRPNTPSSYCRLNSYGCVRLLLNGQR